MCGSRLRILVFAFLVSCVPVSSCASVPAQMSYQGKLTDSSGQPVPDGGYNMRFYMWSSESGGSLLWQEPTVGTRRVEVRGGVFTVNLGGVVPLPASAFTGSTWLETEVRGTLLAPRIQIVSTGYAMRAQIAEGVPDNSITGAKIVDASVEAADIKVPLALSGSSGQPIFKSTNTGTGPAAQFGGYVNVTGGMDVSSSVRVNNDVEAGTLTSLGSLSADGSAYVGENATVGGNLTVSGDAGVGTSTPGTQARLEAHSSTGNAIFATTGGATKTAVYAQNSANGTWVKLAANGNNAVYTKGDAYITSGMVCADRDIAAGEDLSAAQNVVVGRNINCTWSGAAFTGVIGPNGGAPFPRPAYDSGWVWVDKGAEITLYHYLGGDTDRYIVDMQGRSESGGMPHQIYYGGVQNSDNEWWGAWWKKLTTTSIIVRRGSSDQYWVEARVRIWVCN